MLTNRSKWQKLFDKNYKYKLKRQTSIKTVRILKNILEKKELNETKVYVYGQIMFKVNKGKNIQI